MLLAVQIALGLFIFWVSLGALAVLGRLALMWYGHHLDKSEFPKDSKQELVEECYKIVRRCRNGQ